MGFIGYLGLAKRKLLNNKCSSISAIFVFAFATMLSTVLSTLVVSLAGAAFVELQNFNGFFIFYAANESNLIYKLCEVVNIFSIVASACIVLGHVLSATIKRHKEYKSKLIMGATYGNLITEVLVEHIVLLVMGYIIGMLASYALLFVLGLVLGITITYGTLVLVISGLVHLSIVVMATIIPITWVAIK